MNPEELISAARRVLEQAYAPYSGYRVGAALLCEDGSIITGCNVENASYGLCNCAERTAVFSAIAAGKSGFKALAIAASGDASPMPCGACRQVLAEFCDPGFPVYVAGANEYDAVTLGELLPHSFSLRQDAEDE